jgi:hypothetical protein
MTAVFNRCDVGRTVAAAAATQRQQASALWHWPLSWQDRREVLLVVFHRSPLSPFISSSFAVIALRHRVGVLNRRHFFGHRRLNLFVVIAVTVRCLLLLLLCRRVCLSL